MNEQDVCICPVGGDQANPPAGANVRPISISVVFDDEASAQSAEALIRLVASDYECDLQSFRFDELDAPAPGVAAARSACNSDIIVFAIREDRTLPAHIKSWLRLCIGLRDEDQDGALVVLIAKGAQRCDPGSSLLDYLETVALTGRLAFFPSPRGVDVGVTPTRKELELENPVCGSSD
jgi:hypothetical protein